MISPSDCLGSFSISPETPVEAGAFGAWTITITVGDRGIDDGGTIKLSLRGSSDWGTPQFSEPSEDGYTTVHHKTPAKITPRFSFKDNIRPYFWCLTLDVSGDSLSPGDIVTVVLGDTSHGSRGIRAQSFQEAKREIALDLDPTNSNDPRRVATLFLSIIPSSPEIARVIIPTTCEVGKAVSVFCSVDDQWGNPIKERRINSLTWIGDGSVEIDGHHVRFTSPGSGHLEATLQSQGKNFTVLSNPTKATTTGSSPIYWGDMHAQTGETVGAGDEDEYFTFARDQARLDFTSHQGNDFQISDEYWDHLNRTTRRYHQDGSFVVFPGYEWSGNSPVGGDRNVWFLNEGEPIFRSSDWLIKSPVKDPLATNVSQLFSLLKERVGSGNYLLAAHVGGRYADIERGFDVENGPLVEVVSCWGVFEWILFDALKKGYRVGVVANSDGHKGRPGAEHPGALEFGIRGGLTAIYSDELTRSGVFKALKSRHCYGTTGARILLDCSLDGKTMGDEVRISSPQPLSYSVIGCAPIERVELYRQNVCIEQDWSPEFASSKPSRFVRLLWGGSQTRGRTRRIVWSGTISVAPDMNIKSFRPISFDSPSDRIERVDHRILRLWSRTTGDADGVELEIEGNGNISFACDRAKEIFDTKTLANPNEIDFRPQGGLDAFVSAVRYPENPATMKCSGEFTITPAARETPYFIKVTQVDGEMAWSSPFYVST